MRRIAPFLGCALAVVLFAGACKPETTAESSAENQTARATSSVGFVLPSGAGPIAEAMEKGAKEAALAAGVRLMIAGPDIESDTAAQTRIARQMLDEGINVLCIAPNHARAAISAITEANSRDVPVLLIDNTISIEAVSAADAQVASFIGSNHHQAGSAAGLLVDRLLEGRGKIGVIEGRSGDEPAAARVEGFRETVAQSPGLQIAASESAGGDREQARLLGLRMLDEHSDLRAFFASDDTMALGAADAVAAADRSGNVLVIGWGATPEAESAILRGDMHGTISENHAEMARIAIERAVALMQGRSIESGIAVDVKVIDAEAVGKPE